MDFLEQFKIRILFVWCFLIVSSFMNNFYFFSSVTNCSAILTDIADEWNVFIALLVGKL